jgi:hypothetical protein
VTEHLVVAAGSYACQWKYGEQVVSGMLELEASKPPAAEVFDAPGTSTTDGNLRIFEPHGDDLAQLRGWTRRGDAAALLGARVEHFPDGRSFVKAQTALVGDDIPEDMLFGSVEFQVGGLTEISGIRPLKQVKVPSNMDGDPETGAVWDSDATSQEWVTSRGDTARLRFKPSFEWKQHYSFSLTTTPVVFVFGEPRAVGDWLGQYVRPLAEITTFATQRHQPVSWVVLRGSGDNPPPVQVFAKDITQQPYDATPPEFTELLSYGSGALVRLGPGGAALPDLLDGWATLQSAYRTFFDYLTVALRGPMSARSRFLALLPALEGLHVAKYGDGAVPRREYQRQRKSVICRLSEAEGVGQEDVDFVREWLSPLGSYELAYRLREIVGKELGPELRRRIGERVDPLPAVLQGIVDRPRDVWAVMGTVRNRIAHGDSRQPSDSQLAALTRLAHAVATGAALNLLASPETVMCDAIDQERWLVL